jgi:hypothetical protein
MCRFGFATKRIKRRRDFGDWFLANNFLSLFRMNSPNKRVRMGKECH